MKRLVSFSLALVLLFSMGVVSFAYPGGLYGIDPRLDGGWHISDGDLYIGQLKTSLLTNVQKDFLRDAFGDSRSRLAIAFRYYSTKQPPALSFFLYPAGFSFTGDSVVDSNSGIHLRTFPSPVSVRLVSFIFEGGQWIPQGPAIGQIDNPWFHAYLGGGIVLPELTNPQHDLLNYLVDYSGNLVIYDDDGLLPGLPDPDPDPDPPENPNEIDYNYIPYDVSVWDKFLTSVRGSIGSSINIGLIAFAYILAVLIVIRVVNMFLAKK